MYDKEMYEKIEEKIKHIKQVKRDMVGLDEPYRQAYLNHILRVGDEIVELQRQALGLSSVEKTGLMTPREILSIEIDPEKVIQAKIKRIYEGIKGF